MSKRPEKSISKSNGWRAACSFGGRDLCIKVASLLVGHVEDGSSRILKDTMGEDEQYARDDMNDMEVPFDFVLEARRPLESPDLHKMC